MHRFYFFETDIYKEFDDYLFLLRIGLSYKRVTDK
ncbi:hypothetical protein M947_00120 [Sulfurimonas hongkongensis]|uniref:Uncharacterized protein n=1 Tax=Sulfurimonas hongkongensis TaxID=1172190 RepID=T0KUQ5_9BACT|nr:hypothetical protein M947_00120 [Sulfurimonas hongkongensis]